MRAGAAAALALALVLASGAQSSRASSGSAASGSPDSGTGEIEELERTARPLMAATASYTDQLKELGKLYADDERLTRLSLRRRDLRGALLSSLEPLKGIDESHAALLKAHHLRAVTAGLAEMMGGERRLRADAAAEIGKAMALEQFGKELASVRRTAKWVLENDEQAYVSVSGAISSRRRQWTRGVAVGVVALGLAVGAFWAGRSRFGRSPQTDGSAAVSPAPEMIGGPDPGLGGGYRIGRELGKGAMGRVFEATDLTLGRRVAIKRMREELLANPVDVERFLSEARLVAALKHPNIVEIYSIVREHGEVFLVFEFVSGRPLNAFLRERGRLPPELARRLLAGVGAALDYAHGCNVIHRDLKPANIMLGPDADPKVMDFGIAHQARISAARLTRAEALGTPPYMAPEAELGQVARESDVYSLGVCLYEMLTGALPFEGPDSLARKRELRVAPVSSLVAGLPRGIDDAVLKALHPDTRSRFHSAAELIEAFDAALG